MLTKPKTKIETCISEMLRLVVEFLPSKLSLSDVQLVASSLLAYAAFSRFDKLAKLRHCDVVFQQDSMCVPIASGKTDQYPMGDTVLVQNMYQLDHMPFGYDTM